MTIILCCRSVISSNCAVPVLGVDTDTMEYKAVEL